MAYIRGTYYTYSNGESMVLPGSMPMELFDALVMMRYNEMTTKERGKAEKFALKESYGNIGCDAIAKKKKLPTVNDLIKKGLD